MSKEKNKRAEEIIRENPAEEETEISDTSADELMNQIKSLTDENEELIKEYGKAKAEAERLKKAGLEIKAQLDRLQLDFTNFKRRTQEQLGSSKDEGRSEMIEKFFPVIDVVEKAVKMISDEQTASGVKMIETQILSIFAAAGVEEIPALGEPFDPNYHNAVLREQTDDEEKDGKVTEVFQKGYKLGDKVLRHSMVKVAGIN